MRRTTVSVIALAMGLLVMALTGLLLGMSSSKHLPGGSLAIGLIIGMFGHPRWLTIPLCGVCGVVGWWLGCLIF